MKTLMTAATALCALAVPALAQPAAPYKALGTEPFWSLSIDKRTMRFEAPGRPTVTVPTPRPINGFAGEIYRTRRVDVNIVHKSCSDGMSDRSFPDTVTVRVDGRSFNGCGGTPVGGEQRSVVDGDWAVESINGAVVPRGADVRVSFREGRLSGNSGCNSMNGSFRLERGFLTTGPIATTRRACIGRAAQLQERNLLAAFGERLSVSRNRGGKLILTGRGGKKLVLAPMRGGPRRR